MTEYTTYITYGAGKEHFFLCQKFPHISEEDAKRICDEEWRGITDMESRYQATRRIIARAKRL